VPIYVVDIITAHRDYELKTFVEALIQKSRICRRYSGSEASSADWSRADWRCWYNHRSSRLRTKSVRWVAPTEVQNL